MERKLGQAESSNAGFDEKLSEGGIVKLLSLGGYMVGIGVGRGVEIFT